MADPIYFDASYGGIPLLISQFDTDSGRDIAIQSPARGDQHSLQDRGRRLTTTHATLLFITQNGQEDYLTRFQRVHAMMLSGDPQIFSHPLLGSYRARAGELGIRGSGDEMMVELQATIIAEAEPTVVFPAGGGVTGEAGLEAVSTAAALVDSILAEVNLASPVPVAAAAAVTAWSTTDPLDSAQVLAEVATLTGQISTAIDELELATDLTRWQAYRALIGLSFQVQLAGEAFSAAADRMFDVVITTPQPLRALCARIYGAALAEDRAQQVTRLNRVRTPGRVPAGTRLKFPSNGARP